MSLLVKIVLQVIAVVSATLVNVLDYHWHDHDSRRFKMARIGLYSAAAILLVLSIGAAVLDERDHRSEAAALLQSIRFLESQVAAGRRSAEQSATQQKRQLDTLTKANSTLAEQLGPFVELAQARYPQADKESALAKLREDVEALRQQNAQLANVMQGRTVSSTQRARAILILARYPGNKVKIYYTMGDDESYRYARQIMNVFDYAGWEIVSGDVIASLFAEQTSGADILIRSPSPDPPTQAALTAMAEIGIKQVGLARPGTDASVEVEVKFKPH